MELINVAKPIKVLGLKVETFPDGIGETFEILLHHLDTQRSYFGISRCENDVIKYIAAAELDATENISLPGAEFYSIEKGAYLSEPIWDWRKNLPAIKDVFHSLLQDKRVKAGSTCIEWYKDDDLMWCMIRIDS